MALIIEKLKQNLWLSIGISVILICGVVNLLRANQLSRFAAREAELINQMDTINENKKKSQNIEQDIQELNASVASINERLFAEEERAINIDFFYSFEERLNVLISEVKQLEEKNPRYTKNGLDELKLYSVVTYSITVNGSFQEILRFLYEIQQVESIMRVTDFQIDGTGKNDSESGKLIAKLRVAVLAKNTQD